MIRILYLFILLAGTFSSVLAAASAEDLSPQELTRRYMSVLGHTEDIPKITTPREGFDYIVQSITSLSGQPHKHVDSGLQYGWSFFEKNIPPVEFMKELMTGIKTWKKEQILSGPPSIADIGCGLGFSAAYFVSEVVKVYDTEPRWELKSPIKLDLYDITPEHQKALQPLVALVNAAYPQYFHLKTFTHDAKDPFPANQYRVVFALNLMHYIPESDWLRVVPNIENILEKGGMFLVTTDHYCGGASSYEQFQKLEGAAKKRAGEKSALSPLLCLVNPEYGNHFQTIVLNTSFEPFLRDPTSYVPGSSVKIEQVNMKVIRNILKKSAKERFNNLGTIALYNGKNLAEVSIDEVISQLEDGSLLIRLGNYVFDETLLEGAILTRAKGTLSRLKITSWPQKLLKNSFGYPSTVGLTFTRK
jgi:SAM-dependent methyltransferase